MALRSSWVSLARKSVWATRIHRCTAYALVGLAWCWTQPEANGNSHDFIVNLSPHEEIGTASGASRRCELLCAVVFIDLSTEKSLERVVYSNGVQSSLVTDGGYKSLIGQAATENQCFNDVLVSSTAAWVFRKMCDWSGSVPAAEAKKADDASMDTLRTPQSPWPDWKAGLSPLHRQLALYCRTWWELSATDHQTDEEGDDHSTAKNANLLLRLLYTALGGARTMIAYSIRYNFIALEYRAICGALLCYAIK